MVTGEVTGWIFDSRKPASTSHQILKDRSISPSIKHSLTISQSCFITDSGRYLQSLACSSHSSRPALGDSLAGPGWGTPGLGAISGSAVQTIERGLGPSGNFLLR